MILEHIFNIILFSFIMIVPLIPIKFKIGIVPISADFVLGFCLIFIGVVWLITHKAKLRSFKELMKSRYLRLMAVLMGIFIIFSIYSISYAANRTIAISETLRFAEYMAIFFLIIFLVSEITIDRSIKIFYFTMLFACIFGLTQFLFNWSKYTAGGFFDKGRIFSTFVNPNYWGAAINLVIYYPMVSLLENKSKVRWFDISSFILLFINLVLCATKVSWIGFCIGIIVILLTHYRKKLWYVIVLCASCIVALVLKFQSFNRTYVDERLSLWKSGWLMFKNNVLKGVGAGNYVYYYHSYTREYGLKEYGKLQLSVHNSYIKMLAELGIIGGITFAAIYFAVLTLGYDVYIKSKRYKYIALSFIGAISAYLFQNFFNNLAFVPQLNVFVFIIGAMLFKGLYIERQGEEYNE